MNEYTCRGNNSAIFISSYVLIRVNSYRKEVILLSANYFIFEKTPSWKWPVFRDSKQEIVIVVPLYRNDGNIEVCQITLIRLGRMYSYCFLDESIRQLRGVRLIFSSSV